MMHADDADVYEKYADELVRFAAVLVGPSGAEDLLLTTVAALFTSAGWPDVRNKRAYLYRSLVNQASKDRRSTQRRLAREIRFASDIEPDTDPGSLDLDVRLALRHLSVRQRAIVYLRFWQDLTAADIGRALNVPTRTVERDLAKAQARLQEYLR
jgi:RNA polymerase sigma factor (sigma-70 family)